MLDYILLFSSIGAIAFGEVYLLAISQANKVNTPWKLDVLRLSIAIIFLSILIGSCFFLSELTLNSYRYENLKISNFLPLFNFGIYIVLQWRRSIKILKPQKTIHKD